MRIIPTSTNNKDINIEILNRLDDRDLIAFCSSSKYGHYMYNNQILWMRRTISKWKDIISIDIMRNNKGDIGWYDYYIELCKYDKNTNKELVLMNATEKGRLDLVILVLNSEVSNSAKNNALGWASENGDLNIVKYLRSKGADIHTTNEFALKLACDEGHLDVVKYLVSEGADIHNYYEYSLRVASQKGHLDVVKYLISKGADIHARDNYSLRWASENGHLEVVKYLISQGADINVLNNRPLCLASRAGELDVVKYLVSEGADIHSCNEEALRWAIMMGHLNLVKYLVSEGADIHDSCLRLTKIYGHVEIINYLSNYINN